MGRRITILAGLAELVVAWIVTYLANDMAVLLVGRFLSGIAQGVFALTVVNYLVEIATPEVRGFLGSGFMCFLVLGNLFSAIVGAFVNWEILALISGIITLISFICEFFIPESPKWLMMHGKDSKATNVTKWLHGSFLGTEEEAQKRVQATPQRMLTCEEIKQPSFYKPALICIIMMFFQQFTGFAALQFFSTDIFNSTSDVLNPNVSTVLMIAIRVLGSLLVNLLVDRVGRKKLLMTSGFLSAIFLLIYAAYSYLCDHNPDSTKHCSIVKLASIFAYMFTFSVGFSSLPWLLSAEMASTRTRSALSSISTVSNGLFTFLGAKTYEDMNSALGHPTTFWVYAIISLISGFFVQVFVPETAVKGSEEIINYFQNKEYPSEL